MREIRRGVAAGMAQQARISASQSGIFVASRLSGGFGQQSHFHRLT
jgi:hypothetical protein